LKKAISSLLLMVFLFNVGGYYIVFWGLRFQSDQQLTYRLDANLYDAGETVQLKIPVALPYPSQSAEFQRVDGRFEHGGEFYRLVKQKLENDTLYLICIRDQETRELVRTMTDYVQLTQSLPVSSSGQKALNYLSKLIKDFCAQEDLSPLPDRSFHAVIGFGEKSEFLEEQITPIDAPPPRV
jgi:hypothetical protein